MALQYTQGPNSPTYGKKESVYVVTLTPCGDGYTGEWSYLYRDRPKYPRHPVARSVVKQYLADGIWVPAYPTTPNLPSGA